MLRPDYLADLPTPLVELYGEVEAEIMQSIVRKIIRFGGLTPSALYQVERLRDMRALDSEITKKLAAALRVSEKEVARLLREAGVEALKSDDAIYRAVGMNPAPFVRSPALNDILVEGINKTNGVMKNFTATTANAAHGAFGNSMDKAYLEVMSGAYSPNEAIRKSVSTLAKQGIQSVAYPSGRANSIESAVRRALLTGANQTVASLRLARADEMGCDLVEVTSHPGARTGDGVGNHASWQGKIYSRSGTHKKYKELVESTGFGSGEGLCGWNCGHNFHPFFEGFSVPTNDFDPSAALGKSNNQMYEESQRQRELERRVRASKNECVTLKEAIALTDDADLKDAWQKDFDKAAHLLKQREAVLSEFVSNTGRTRYREREQVQGFNRSVSSAAVQAAKRA